MAATETEAAPRRFTLPLAAKFFLGTAFLIALAVAAAVIVTYLKGAEIAQSAVDDALAKSSAVQKQFEQDRLEQLQLKVQLIAADPATAKYVAQASAPSASLPGLSESRERDTQSIADLLGERKAQYGFDLGIVLDAKGTVLGRTDQTEAFAESLADDAFVQPAIAKATPFSGYWRQGDKLYQAAIMPLQQDRALAGFLLLAQRVDDALARAMAKISGGQIAFWLPRADKTGPAASSFDETQAKALSGALATLPQATLDAIHAGKPVRFSLTFAGQNWAANAAPTAEGAGDLGAALALTSSDAIVASYRAILNAVLMAGLAAIAIALLLSYLLTRGILQPVRAMAQAAEQAAAGNYQTRVGVSGNDEVGRLSRAFDSLLSDLREKSDIEGYVGSLSRYLPEPSIERTESPAVTTHTPAPQPAARCEAFVLLGLEFRELSRPDTTAALQSRFETILARLDGAAQRCGGRLHGLHGSRFVLAFSGEGRLVAALNALAQVRDETAAAGESAPAAAVVAGELVDIASAREARQFDAWLGPGMFQIERLLTEAQPGYVLIARQASEEFTALLGVPQLALVTGAISGKSFYALGEHDLEKLPAPPRAAQQAATRVAPVALTIANTPPRGGALTLGSLFGARYEILAELGSGGMGVVYKAHDRELDDVVALKMLKPAAWSDAQQLERLKSEIKLARRITHPNVLRTFDFGEIDGRAFISMEYVRGLTLRYLLNETGRIPYSAALRIARQLVWGLIAAHAVGVLHRDIKPENLILEANGNAKLMDFGIARPARRAAPGQTEAGTFVGTPNYSPPEQLAGDEVDERADIYAAGVVLCEMFCGALPFRGTNTMEIYLAQMQSEPIKPSAYWPEIPPALENLILRCIARNPADRFQSAVELSRALVKLRA